jgi:hypothetical protein
MMRKLRFVDVMSFVATVTLAFSAIQAATPVTPTTRPADDSLARLDRPFKWITTAPVISAKGTATHPINALKDPSVVFYNGLWHLFATSCTKTGQWGMVYVNFADWKDAATAPQYYMDQNPNLGGYHCAPQVFYFAPQKLWYLITVSQDPRWSTTSDISKPESWTKQTPFFAEKPKSLKSGWLDYWIICDETHAYMFFTDDGGRFWRSRTKLADFPNGFDEPVIALQEKLAKDLFEGSCTYRIKGTTKYLTLVEAGGENWKRYYRAFIADTLDGEWKPLAAEWGNSFADLSRVRTEDGSEVWSENISHGEILRDSYDQTLTIDPAHLQLLYQGIDTHDPHEKDYGAIRWQLGLLRRDE